MKFISPITGANQNYFPLFVGLVCGLVFFIIPVIGYTFTYYPGDLIDARFCNYILEHDYLFFTGKVSEYWNAPFMFPEKDVISYSDNFLGTAPIYAIFRIIGFNRETSFQFWYIVICVLNYTVCFIFLKQLYGNAKSAALGAFVFAFSMALQCQMGHAQTMARFPIPLAFLFGVLFLKNFKPFYFFVSLLSLVYQFYCGIYLGFLLAVPLAIFFIFSVLYFRKLYLKNIVQWKWTLKLFIAVLLNILILLPLILPYIERANQVSLYTYEQIQGTLLTPLSFFFSWHGSLFWDFLSGIATHYQWYTNYQVFTGGVASLCLIISALLVIKKMRMLRSNYLNNQHKVLIVLAITALVTFLFFTRFGNNSLYKFLFHLPGFASMRALQRIINIELLFYALAVSFVFINLTKERIRLSRYLFVGMLFLICADNYTKTEFIHRHEKSESYQRINPLIKQLESFPKQTVISYEPDTVDSSINDYHLDVMLAAQSLNLITINGYSSTSPQGYSDYWMNPKEYSRKSWLERKGMLSQKIVVIH